MQLLLRIFFGRDDLVDYFKAEAEGVNAMCELMEKFGEKKMEEGHMEGLNHSQ